jgi:hypothetical protein
VTAPSSEAEVPPPPPLAVKPPRLFRRAYNVLRSEPKATLLPLLVTQIPLALGAAAAYFVLFFHVYGDVAFDSFEPLRTGPDGLKLSLFVVNAIYLLFTAVGLSATITAVNAVLAGRPLGLASALDPSFTRMGGLLVLGVVFQVMFALTIAGVVLLLYVILRFGLAFHVYMLENLGVWPSLRRSWGLLRRGMLRFVGSLVVPALLVLGVFMAAFIVLTILALPFAAEDAGRTRSLVVSTVELGALGIIAAPCGAYFAAVTTILYLDLKGSANV